MSPAQIALLKDLINEDRRYWRKVLAGEPVHRDERGVEVGWSCNSRTAQSLVDAGLAEIVNIRTDQNWIFLGSYEPTEAIK